MVWIMIFVPQGLSIALVSFVSVWAKWSVSASVHEFCLSCWKFSLYWRCLWFYSWNFTQQSIEYCLMEELGITMTFVCWATLVTIICFFFGCFIIYWNLDLLWKNGCHMEIIKGIQGHGYYDELVIPITETTARERELTDFLAKAEWFLLSLFDGCTRMFWNSF